MHSVVSHVSVGFVMYWIYIAFIFLLFPVNTEVLLFWKDIRDRWTEIDRKR